MNEFLRGRPVLWPGTQPPKELADEPAEPRRLTRIQKRDQTRESLLLAARAIFVKKGYADASIEEIAVAAGYTRGAFYSNFNDKTDLLIVLLARDCDEIEAELQRLLTSETGAVSHATVLLPYVRRARRKDSSLIWMEAKLQAVRDADFRVHFKAIQRDRQAQLTTFLLRLAERTGVCLPLPADRLSAGLIGLCDGLQPCYAVEPTRAADEFTEEVMAGFFAFAMPLAH